jgi:hypothetical protein
MAPPAATNGALLKSHEGRLQRVEDVTSELLSSVAKQGATLEAIGDTVKGIDLKLDVRQDALIKHEEADQDVALRVHDLEQTQKGKDKWSKYVFLPAIALVVGDVLLKFVEHIPKLLGH